MQPYLFEGESMRFNRTISLVGQDPFTKLQQHTILIFGIGGVGSYAAEAIARSGFDHIILVDRDIVDPTNINRQLIALESTIGEDKVLVMKKRIADIHPECVVDIFKENVTSDNIAAFFYKPVDYILDCVDDISAKLSIAQYALQNQIPLIASMGFANKLDPQRITVSLAEKTSVCPLAKAYRNQLKKRGLPGTIPVVYSTENPIVPEGEVKLASSAFVPSAAGLMMAAYVFNDLLAKGESR